MWYNLVITVSLVYTPKCDESPALLFALPRLYFTYRLKFMSEVTISVQIHCTLSAHWKLEKRQREINLKFQQHHSEHTPEGYLRQQLQDLPWRLFFSTLTTMPFQYMNRLRHLLLILCYYSEMFLNLWLTPTLSSVYLVLRFNFAQLWSASSELCSRRHHRTGTFFLNKPSLHTNSNWVQILNLLHDDTDNQIN